MNREKHITVIAKITSSCNLRCPYCYTKHTISKPKKIMPLETFEKIIQNLSKYYDSFQIIYHGGEPLLASVDWYRSTVEIIKRYQRMYGFDYKLGIQSNITLMNEEYDKFFRENGIRVGFSFDGLNNEKTRKNTDVIIGNKKKYNSVGGCICLITKDNYLNIEDELDYFEKLGLSVKLNTVFETTTGVENELTKMTKEGILECYIKAFIYSAKREKSPCDGEFDHFIANHPRGSCSRINCSGSWISVHPNGEMYPCGQEWDQFEKYSYGNINDLDFNEVFLSDKAIGFSNKFKSKIDICKEKGCEVFNICHGGCPGENKANGADIDSFIEEHCYLTVNLKKYIDNYIENNMDEIKNLEMIKLLEGRDNGGNKCGC